MAKKLADFVAAERAKIGTPEPFGKAVPMTSAERSARQIVIMADDPADKQMIKKAAKAAGVSMTSFILGCVLECIRNGGEQ